MSATPFISWLLLITLVAQSGYAFQADGQVRKLNIEIIEGEGAVNNIRQRVAREPMVQVTDENRKPVAGAVVVFLLPNQGAGGAFADGARSMTTLTDANGNAVARGMQANRLPGQYQIQVTASFQGQTASLAIGMTNAAIAGAGTVAGLSVLKWLLIVGVAGGAAAGVAVATTGGGTPSRGSTTVTPGTPSVGAPR